ncbi:hypothetical protein Tco_1430684 [Tanacetum coccineum]
MGRFFKTVGLRWIPTGKIFTSSTTKFDNEPPNGLNEDVTNLYECEQTLNVSAGTLNLSSCTSLNPKKERLRTTLQTPLLKEKKGVRFSALYLQKKRNLLPLFDEYFTHPPSVASLVLAVLAPVPADSTDTPSSTTIDQDAPSINTSQIAQESQSPLILSGV